MFVGRFVGAMSLCLVLLFFFCICLYSLLASYIYTLLGSPSLREWGSDAELFYFVPWPGVN